jgi:hypothetical protein
MSATPPTYFPGETIRCWASDLLHLDDGPITSGATVTFVLTDLAGTEEAGGGAGTASNDDWYIDVTMPTTPGSYFMKGTAVVDGVTWKGKMPFNVGVF